jgi:heptosyltransferase-1
VAAALLGEPLAAAAPLLPVDEQARSWCRAWVGGRGPLVVLMPGAGWGAKRWPAERYARVAGELVGRGAEVVVNVGPGEAGLAEAICRPSGARALECSLSRLIELLRGARLAIGGDTGPLHLAAALGVPVVAIFGPTDPARNGPYGVPMRVLRHPDSRRDHARRAHPEAGLLTIEPAEVLGSAIELLGEARTCPPAENPAGTLPTP